MQFLGLLAFLVVFMVRIHARRKAIRAGQMDPSTWTGLPSEHPRERRAEWIATWVGKALAFVIVAFLWLYAIHVWAPDLHSLLNMADRLWRTLTGQ